MLTKALLVTLESFAKLQSELTAAKAKAQATVSTANGDKGESKELATRIEQLEQELQGRSWTMFDDF